MKYSWSNIKSGWVFVIFLLGMHSISIAQSLNVTSIFSPGLNVGTEYLAPSQWNDSITFQLSKYKMKFSQPLRTKVGVALKDFNFKKMDAKASQLFLEGQFNAIKPYTSVQNNFTTIVNGSIGVKAIFASIRKGIWIYSGSLYFSENSSSFTQNFEPNFKGYIANIKTKNFKTFYIYGGGLLVHQGQIIPFPLLGLKTKLAKKLRAEVLLPVNIKLNYKVNKKISFDAVANYSGINTVYRDGSAFKGTDQSVNLRQVKTYLAVNGKMNQHYKIRIEFGYSSFAQLHQWKNKETQSLGSAPFVGLSVNYNFGKSVFGNFMSKAE